MSFGLDCQQQLMDIEGAKKEHTKPDRRFVLAWASSLNILVVHCRSTSEFLCRSPWASFHASPALR